MTAMQGDMRSRGGVLIGLAATVGAFGAAAIISTTTAPTARADAYSDIIASIDGDYALGQADFTNAAADFGNLPGLGLAELLDGVNEDFVAAPDNLLVGTVEALANEPISTDISLALPLPTDFADAASNAQIIINEGAGDLSAVAGFLSAGEYGTAALSDLFGSQALSVFPLEELLLGAVAQF
jgi:hypothetical protein